MSYVLVNYILPGALWVHVHSYSKIHDSRRRARHRDAIMHITRSQPLLILTPWTRKYTTIAALLRINERKCVIGSEKDYEQLSAFYDARAF